VAALSRAGFVAAEEEARELLAIAAGDDERLDALVARRLTGEPLAWITGRASFCGLSVRVDPGVYVPRWQSEPLARRAVERLPPAGVAVDVCTGSGAIAAVLRARRPLAVVVATELEPRAAACAASNGVDVLRGDVLEPIDQVLLGRVDVIVGVVPYVPTPALPHLPSDTLVFESTFAYDGGLDGTRVLRRVIWDATTVLRPGGSLLLELGGEQADLLADDLVRAGYTSFVELADDEGDLRGIEATFGTRP
jgi:release factor glutamine methyltransferase